MGTHTCPTCHGTGAVSAEEALAAYEARDGAQDPWSRKPLAAAAKSDPWGEERRPLCSCDGPPHAYSPGWCPASGPVQRGYQEPWRGC